MPCGKDTVTAPGQTINVTITPVSNVLTYSMKVLDILLDVDTTNRATYHADELASGVSWTLKPNRSYVLLLTIVKTDYLAKVNSTITIGGNPFYDQECSKGSPEPVTCEWTVTTWGE